MKQWLSSNADLLTNILDFIAFLLVTPDIVGKDRLERLRVWLETHPLALPGIGRPGIVTVVGAMILAFLVLASGRYISAWWNWASTLATPLNYVMEALNVIWGGFLIFAFLPSFYTITAGILFSAAELLRLTVVKWEISGIMLIVGAFVFTCSRSLAIWHAVNKSE
jgi:hypothetical protein